MEREMFLKQQVKQHTSFIASRCDDSHFSAIADKILQYTPLLIYEHLLGHVYGINTMQVLGHSLEEYRWNLVESANRWADEANAVFIEIDTQQGDWTTNCHKLEDLVVAYQEKTAMWLDCMQKLTIVDKLFDLIIKRDGDRLVFVKQYKRWSTPKN